MNEMNEFVQFDVKHRGLGLASWSEGKGSEKTCHFRRIFKASACSWSLYLLPACKGQKQLELVTSIQPSLPSANKFNVLTWSVRKVLESWFRYSTLSLSQWIWVLTWGSFSSTETRLLCGILFSPLSKLTPTYVLMLWNNVDSFCPRLISWFLGLSVMASHIIRWSSVSPITGPLSSSGLRAT